MEKRLRSLAKTISWRIVATLTTVALVFVFTRNLEISFNVGGLELIVKTAIYYLHERAWNLTDFGRGTQKQIASKPND